MSGYTPDEEEVRDAWCAFMAEPFGYWDALDDAEADARFNRFLADDRRKTAAKAWGEAIQALVWALENGTTDAAIEYVLANNPYESGGSGV